MTSAQHAVVLPLYGPPPDDLAAWLDCLVNDGFVIFVVQNNPPDCRRWKNLLSQLLAIRPHVALIHNENRGGVAGGFNRGVEIAIQTGCQWITLLDQDSRLAPVDLHRLREPWQSIRFNSPLLVGPMILDSRRLQSHGRSKMSKIHGFRSTRLLISSGTTFRAVDWQELNPMEEWLVVDYIDHCWSFQAKSRGFLLLQHPDVRLVQNFGDAHPNSFCRLIGMELYSPMRHFYQLRNLRWLLVQSEAPIDIRFKELIKMLVKPWLWLLCEPHRFENLQAILAALRAPLKATRDG